MKVVARRFLVHIAGRLHRPECRYRRFLIALRTMAGDEVKDDVNTGTSSFKRSSMMFCTCVCLYDHNQLCIEH